MRFNIFFIIFLDGYRNISNCLSIGSKIDKMSKNLKEKAAELGYWNSNEEFNFTKVFTSPSPDCSRYESGKKLLQTLTKDGIPFLSSSS